MFSCSTLFQAFRTNSLVAAGYFQQFDHSKINKHDGKKTANKAECASDIVCTSLVERDFKKYGQYRYRNACCGGKDASAFHDLIRYLFQLVRGHGYAKEKVGNMLEKSENRVSVLNAHLD